MSDAADPRARRVGAWMLAAHILSMLGFSTYPALLPELKSLWQMSNAEAGAVGSAFFLGYVGTVSFWTALTDRVDPRRVYAVAGVLAGAGSLAFAGFAGGWLSASLAHALLGAGIAASYMPGLRLLSDRTSGPAQSRHVAFYTSFFGIGTALSLAFAGMTAEAFGWRTAFALSAAGPVAASLLVWFLVQPAPRTPPAGRAISLELLFPLRAWRRVLAVRAAAGYTAGYAVHCIELFGSRGWMVAFLAFSMALQPAGAGFPWQAAAIAALVNLFSVPASILGNEAALRVGRRRWILIAMAGSSLCGVVLAFAAPLAWPVVLLLLIVYSMLVMAESATLTAGLVATAPAADRGAAMGLYSLAGFGGGMLGPVLFGAALDAAGGGATTAAWAAGYAVIGAGCLAAPLVTLAVRRRIAAS